MFKDIYDFVERVNLSACNRGAIENLAMAGAFDCFGLRREMFVHEVFDSTWTDILVKYGQNIQNDKNSLQMSLFGELEPIETARPPYPDCVPWSSMALLDKEKEMVMMYLSAHPLDPYYMEITYGCNTTCEDFKDAERAGNKVTMAGLVTKVSTKMSRKGTEFSIIELEDFSGKAEIRLFGRNHQTLREKFREGEPVYLKISYTESRFNPDRIDVSFDEIHPLEDMKGKIANAIMLFIDMQYKDKDFFQAITGIKDKSRPGDLYIDLVDSGKKCNVRVHARKKIPLNKELVDLLENNGIRFKMATI